MRQLEPARKGRISYPQPRGSRGRAGCPSGRVVPKMAGIEFLAHPPDRMTMMSYRLVTLATFPAPPVAGFVRNLLAAEGVRAFFADEMTTLLFWHLRSAFGWAKVQVEEADVARATELLGGYRQTLLDLGPEAFATEATNCPAAEDGWDSMSALPAVGDREDDIVEPTEGLASRALRSAVIGLVFTPIAFYGAWLVGRLIWSQAELNAKAARYLWAAFSITFAQFLAYAAMLTQSPIVFGTCGVVLAAFCIRELVRWVNRRQSPR